MRRFTQIPAKTSVASQSPQICVNLRINNLQEPDAHTALDQATLAAYNFSPKQDLLSQLLDLNHTVAAKVKAGEKVTAPGIPTTYGPDTRDLITDDCIKP